MKIFACTLDREEFVGWLGRKFEPVLHDYDSGQLPRIVKPDDVVLIWKDKPGRRNIGGDQPIISVSSRNMREFFAFVGTYVSTYQPFTAFFRVVPLEEVPDLIRDERAHDRGYRSDLSNALVGALIAEAKLQAGERVRRASELSIQACLATMSSVAVGALISGSGQAQLDLVTGRWLKIRNRLNERGLSVDPERIRSFWGVVAAAYHPTSDRISDRDSKGKVKFLMDVAGTGDDENPSSWSVISGDIPRIRYALEQMKESREDRIRALDEAIVGALGTAEVDVEIREMLLGYLASRVAGGSLAYLELLKPVEKELPLALLWLGLFSSMRSDSDVMTAGDCLGRRISRRLARPFDIFAMPQVDIGFEEFDMFDGRSEIKLRTEHQGAISIEIAPAVVAVFRFNKVQPDVEDRNSDVAPALARELRYLVGRLASTVEALDPQRRLFDDSAALPQRGSGPKSRKSIR